MFCNIELLKEGEKAENFKRYPMRRNRYYPQIRRGGRHQETADGHGHHQRLRGDGSQGCAIRRPH